MTDDQMPDEIKLGMAFTTKNNKRSCYVVGFVVGGNPLFRFDDDMSFSSLELSMVVRDEKHDICDFFPQNTRATPPKSQGVVWENVVELCHALTLARGIISVWCKDAPKENLSDWDIKWEASNKAIVAIQEATRQHPTPEPQGEPVYELGTGNLIGHKYFVPLKGEK